MKAPTSNLAGQRLQLNGRVHTADQIIKRPWVRISPDAGLFSTTSFLYFLSHFLKNWLSVQNQVPQGGASLLIMRQPKISISSCAACGQTSVKYSQNGIKQKIKVFTVSLWTYSTNFTFCNLYSHQSPLPTLSFFLPGSTSAVNTHWDAY